MMDPADTPEAPQDGRPRGIDAARLVVREAGYCVLCNRIVERRTDGSCPAEHPAEAITGRIVLGGREALPVLPAFNLAAFLIPPVWGPAHGQWVGAIFLPIWLFMDSIIATADRSPFGWLVAAFVVLATLAFQAVFARRANGLAFRRVWDRVTVEEFVARQRVWAAVSIPLAVALVGWAVYFRLVLAPGL